MAKGKVVSLRKAPKGKGGTPSSRRHRFESFSERVAKIKVDPVRRIRHDDLLDDDVSASSYFMVALNEWQDLNLSENFTRFARDVQPFCATLPQLLHHEDDVMALLATYIELEDALSLEPLLSLLSHFAHDLGARFEKHFGRSAELITRLASKHQEIEVVEWSFTCLAWLFKYLSRLLVPDIRPVYDLFSPLLGKERQKPFVVRFAAEALSFLVRKAGSVYHRDANPLTNIISHVLDDVYVSAGEDYADLFQAGIMTLLSESIKGVNRSIHSTGSAIFGALSSETLTITERTPQPTKDQAIECVERVLRGVLIAIVHHTEAETFKPILDSLIGQVRVSKETHRSRELSFLARLLFTVTGVRAGSRIEDWTAVVDETTSLFGSVEKTNPSEIEKTEILALLAVVLQSCPPNLAVAKIRLLERVATNQQWRKSYLPFTQFFADLGMERFEALLLPSLKKFIISYWQTEKETLCVLLTNLSKTNSFNKLSLPFPKQWQQSILSAFEQIDDSNTEIACIPLCHGLLELNRFMTMDVDNEKALLQQMASLFHRSLNAVPERTTTSLSQFALGPLFDFIVRKKYVRHVDDDAWQALCRAAEGFKSTHLFWQAMHGLIEQRGDVFDLSGQHMVPLKHLLFDGMASSSQNLRLVCLRTLGAILKCKSKEQSNLLATAILIEESPITMQSARTTCMYVRRLGAGYQQVSHDEYLGEAIPYYCFGLLHLRLAPVWAEAYEALEKISAVKEGEKIVSDFACQWITQPGSAEQTMNEEEPFENTDMKSHVETEFECTNLNKLHKLIRDSENSLHDSPMRLKQKFVSRVTQEQLRSPNSRMQALQLFNKIPQVAEKRSRMLVPFLLDWAGTADGDLSGHDRNDSKLEIDKDGSRWTRKELKTLLSLFAQFKNPRVLYRSSEVHDALLSLLANGDVEIQKSAFKALLAWKVSSINRYEESLLNLLDDQRFREQISVFLNVGDDDNTLRKEDQQAVMPVLLRMLYGKVVTRSGSAGRQGQESRRKAVFVALTRFKADVLEQFLSIALGPLHRISLFLELGPDKPMFATQLLHVRKQVGLLNMLKDMIDTLATLIIPHLDLIVEPILYCTVKACRAFHRGNDDSEADSYKKISTSLLRTVRQVGMQCLTSLMSIQPAYDWAKYMCTICEELVGPRIENLPIESMQSVSGLLRLFAAWASSPRTALFLLADSRILPRVVDCLASTTTKEDVKLFILNDVILSLTEITGEDKSASDAQEMRLRIQQEILSSNSNMFLFHIRPILHGNASKALLEVATQTLAELVEYIQDAEGLDNFIETCNFLLQQPAKRVNPKTKSDLLEILRHLIPRCDMCTNRKLFENTYTVVSHLFAFFKDRVSRMRTSAAMKALARYDSSLEPIANLCEDLNSFSATHVEEPDFQRRSRAYNIINEEKHNGFEAMQWIPLISNMVFYIKEQEELIIRTSASFGLRRFLEAAAGKPADEQTTFLKIVEKDILPSIRHGISTAPELVRTEYLAVMAAIVRHFPHYDAVKDLKPLLVGNDDEASFFTNVLHIQQHRRIRALKRLTDAARAGELSSFSIHSFLLPLLEHFVFDQEDSDSARDLAAAAISTIGSLASGLEWSQYKSLLKRYTAKIDSKQDMENAATMEKAIIKLLGSTIDALSEAGKARNFSTVRAKDADDIDGAMDIDRTSSRLAESLPSQDKVCQELLSNVLPLMTSYLHQKNESTVNLRVPVAVAASKLLHILPSPEFNARISSVLLDVSNILRSKASEARDMARKTLAEIASIIGPAYFGFILKALRSALPRGAQLHVLSYTMHTILVACSPDLHPGDLDYVLGNIVTVIMDDTFGVTGQEKDSKEYTSKMKEVKSSKSYDSMELIAKVTSLQRLADLVRPLLSLLQEKLNIKTTQKIDELLRRIGVGVSQNETAKDRGILVFSYEILNEAHKAKNATPDVQKQVDYKTRRYLINMNGAKGVIKGGTTSQVYKTTRFALDLLRVTIRKNEHLQTPENMDGFMPVVNDALVESHEEVQTAAVRLLTTIIKMRWTRLDDEAPAYIHQCVRMVKSAPSTNTTAAQAALKLVAAILRERRNVQVPENSVAFLVRKIKPDLEEPDRQGVTFNFIRAVLGRKIVITEIYELIDAVAVIMITNHSRASRDLARGTYFQFLMEYPQAKRRLSKQLAFLIRNLEYQHSEGRQSVMEALNLILTKFGDDLVQEVLNDLFAPLVRVMVNDESKDCREMAGTLIKMMFERADDDRSKGLRKCLRTWLEPGQKALLRRLSLQCWMLYFEVHGAKPKDVTFVLDHITDMLSQYRISEDDDAWQPMYFALQTLLSISESPSSTAKSSSSASIALGAKAERIWTEVCSSVSYPHAWVKLSASKLVNAYFADFAASNKAEGLQALPLRGSGSVQMTGEMMLQLTYASLRVMKTRDASEDITKQAAQNLLFLGRCFAANKLTREPANDEAVDEGSMEDDDDEEEEGEELRSVASDDDDDNDERTNGTTHPEKKLALQFLFERLSYIIRREPSSSNKASALHPKTACMRVIGALCKALDGPSLGPHLETVLLPLHNLTDTSIPAPSSLDEGFNAGYRDLKSAAQEILELLQEKLGTTAFVERYQAVRTGVRQRREGRRVKRRIEAVAKPEKVGEVKRRKREAARGKRKERNMEFRDRRKGR